MNKNLVNRTTFFLNKEKVVDTTPKQAFPPKKLKTSITYTYEKPPNFFPFKQRRVIIVETLVSSQGVAYD